MNKDQSISQQDSTETAQQAVKPSGNKKGADGLTATQRLFLTEYLKDGNATKAASRQFIA